MLKASLYQALEHFSGGRLKEAASACNAILAVEFDHTEANHLLGIINFQQGRTAIARDYLARATKAAAATAEMHNNYGVVLNGLEEFDEAEAAFERALTLRPEYGEAFNNIGSTHRLRGRIAQAVQAFRHAIVLKPDYAEAKANLRAAYRDVIPAWHFAMMNDGARNDAYNAAINRVAVGKRVLDIGTGAGLLAMMAARAGASHVTSCEKVDLIADHARVIVAENGLSDRVTVIGKASTELGVGSDLPARADLLVTEIFSSGLLNEGVLATIEHAHDYLLTSDARIVPFAASAFGYLVGGTLLRDRLFTERANGFGLAPFNDFAPPKIGLPLDCEPHEILSDDFELIRFDLSQNSFPMTHHQMAIKATRRGECVGIAQWLQLELDSEIRYANRPSSDSRSNGWTHIVYRFPRTIPVEPGHIVRIVVRHDREQLSVDLVE